MLNGIRRSEGSNIDARALPVFFFAHFAGVLDLLTTIFQYRLKTPSAWDANIYQGVLPGQSLVQRSSREELISGQN